MENTFYPEVQDELLLTPMVGFASALTVMRNTALELCKSQNEVQIQVTVTSQKSDPYLI